MSLSVYFDDRELVLTNDLDSEIHKGFDAIHEFYSYGELKQFIDKFQVNALLKRGILYGLHEEQLLVQLKACFKYIEAAGGLIRNADNAYLFIYRRGKWDLPKGKCEKDETYEQTALREVKEECGLQSCAVIEPLFPTFHTYEMNNKRYLKKTVWYKMESNQTDVKPQSEEGIVKVEWFKPSDFKIIKENTYPSVWDVIRTI